jgi:hypothetical protein
MDKPTPTQDSAQAVIKRLLYLEGFETASEFTTRVQRRVSLFRSQGRDLTEECGNMSLAMIGIKGLDYTQAGEIYHEYLEAEGFFSGEKNEYIYLSAESDCCSCQRSCVEKKSSEL